MLVVSDTTAITTLLKAGLESVLEQLFGTVVIPAKVAEELLRHHPKLPTWCVVRQITDDVLLRSVAMTIDPGEAEAICLSLELKADAILLDDRKGRREAEARGLSCLSLPAILLQARREGLISSLREVMDVLASRGNYRLKASALAALLVAAGEL